MLRTITTKCPCGYRYVERNTILFENFSDKKSLNEKNYIPIHKVEHVVNQEVIEGNESFRTLFVIPDYCFDPTHPDRRKLIVCPKCGTVLLAEIAINEVEES